MTVISIDEAQAHATAIEGRKGISYKCPYVVTTDNDRDDANVVLNYFQHLGRGLNTPLVYGDMRNPLSFCSEIAPVRQSNSTRHWNVMLTYEPPQGREPQSRETPEGGMSENPADWRKEVEIGTQLVQVPVWKAWNVDEFPLGGGGDGYVRAADTLGPVVNSAGIVLDPPLMSAAVETYYRIKGWASYHDALHTDGVAGRINGRTMRWADDFRTGHAMTDIDFDPYTLKVTGAAARYTRLNDEPWWEFEYELRYRQRYNGSDPTPWDGWLEQVLDRGLTRWAGPGGDDGFGGSYSLAGDDHEDGMADAAAIKGPAGDRVGELVLLDGHGGPLTTADSAAAAGVYFRWRINPIFQSSDFALFLFT